MVSDSSIQLIQKILNNTASDAEIDQFNSWLESSEDNRKFYRQVKIIWENSGKIYDSDEFNEATAKENIISKIRRKHSKSREFKARFLIAVAASFLIMFGIVFLFFNSGLFKSDALLYSSAMDEIRELVLSDGSHIWLNENSTLEVAHAFNKRKRKVFLRGEAYFEVTRNEEKVFKAVAGKTTTKVLGTSFNLKCDKNGNVQIIVKSGEVEFYNSFGLKKKKTFEAGDKGNYLSSGRTIVQERNKNSNYLAWKTGILNFSDTPIGEVCKILSDHYKIRVESTIEDSGISLTGTFENEDLEEILSTISITLDLAVSRSENVIVLHKQ